MTEIDLSLLKAASAHIATAIKAYSETAPTQALVETQAAIAKLQSILSRTFKTQTSTASSLQHSATPSHATPTCPAS